MNFFSFFKQQVLSAVLEHTAEFAWNVSLDFSKVTLELPKDSTHGDVSTNIALILGKQVGEKNLDIAHKLLPVLTKVFPKNSILSIAGPGFINVTLPLFFWQDHLKMLLKNKDTYGPEKSGIGKKVHIEFVSANPTGPMHTGHSRNAVLGDAIASVLEAVGHTVHREYYINDAGGQVDTLARSVYLRYLQRLGKTILESEFEGLYPGAYVHDIAEKVYLTHGDRFLNIPDVEWLPILRPFIVEEVMIGIKQDLRDLGVVMDTYTSEAMLARQGKVDEAIAFLKERGDVYVGVLEPPKGQVIEDFEPRPQTLFKSTKYGDTIDRPLQKSDGSWTYFAPDIAYHFDKFQRGFSDLVDVLSADHVGYFSRIKAAVTAMTDGKATFTICNYNLVNFLENGVPVKMSKRSGAFITLKELLERVGRDVVRFIMLTRHHNMPIDFDFVKVLEQNKDNPIFYVQYAHARICSVLRHAKTLWPMMDTMIQKANMENLIDESEINLIKMIAQYPKTIELSALLREPHRISYYLYELASCFHRLWNRGKENTQLRFIDENSPEASADRLALLSATQYILAACLRILKIDPVQEMR